MRQSIKYSLLFILFNIFVTANYTYGQTILSDTVLFHCKVNKADFDTLKGEDFISEIFKSINDTISLSEFYDRPTLLKCLTPNQKVLFYTYELERAVNGGSGFSNFYYNYNRNFSKTVEALIILKDTSMLKVLNGVHKIYLKNYNQIKRKYQRGNWNYTDKMFASFDKAYLKRKGNTMKLLENFVRVHAGEFIQFN